MVLVIHSFVVRLADLKVKKAMILELLSVRLSCECV
jgi:hypothetical protein